MINCTDMHSSSSTHHLQRRNKYQGRKKKPPLDLHVCWSDTATYNIVTMNVTHTFPKGIPCNSVHIMGLNIHLLKQQTFCCRTNCIQYMNNKLFFPTVSHVFSTLEKVENKNCRYLCPVFLWQNRIRLGGDGVC
jgi:hypothetical protein